MGPADADTGWGQVANELGSGVLVKLFFTAWWTLVAFIAGTTITYYALRGLGAADRGLRATGRFIRPPCGRRLAGGPQSLKPSGDEGADEPGTTGTPESGERMPDTPSASSRTSLGSSLDWHSC
jgi:hypothetical protein